MSGTSVRIEALFTGKVESYAGWKETSAIVKTRCAGPVRLTYAGLAGDEQADKIHHGGPDKALHHYPFDHYAHWQTLAPAHPLLMAPGSLGENLSTFGLTEDQVSIGDRFRLGTALVEISQGRKPCWKLGKRMDWTTLPALITRSNRCGWYYRVIEEGDVAQGDAITLMERPLPDWNVARVFSLIIGGAHKTDRHALRVLADMPQLFDGWRQRALDLFEAQP
jgi:MOSC domain-containing protein YiiM